MDIIKTFAVNNNLKVIDISKFSYVNMTNIMVKIGEKPNILLVLDHNIPDEYINRFIFRMSKDDSKDMIRVFYKLDNIWIVKPLIVMKTLEKWYINLNNDVETLTCNICFDNHINLINCPTCFVGYCNDCLIKNVKTFKNKKCSFCKEELPITISYGNRKGC